VLQDHYFRMLLWLIAVTPIWILGAVVAPDARLLWWGLAVGIDTIGRWLAHPIPGRRLQSEDIPFDADHMLEGCRPFLLIALGETVFTIGSAIATASITLMTLVTGSFALVGTVALWALSLAAYAALFLVGASLTSLAILDQRMPIKRKSREEV
jgi:low temperature requirement protein LtrA